MNDLKFIELFGEIDEKIVQQANDDLNFWQESREGVVVRAGSPRISPLKIVFASAACAAVLFGAVFLLRNYLKNGFTYVPDDPDNSSVQSGETSNVESEYTLNSDVMWAIGKTVDEVAERYGGVTGGGGYDEAYQFKNGYGKLYSWFGEGGGCKVIVNVSASDLLTGDLSTVDLDNMASKYGLENFSYNLDPYQMAGPDYATASFSHPSYKNIWFVMTFKKGGFDEKGGLDDTATFYIRYYDDDEFEKILENVNKPLSRAECEQIVAHFKSWGDLNENIHPDPIGSTVYFPECVDASQFITEEVTTIDGFRTYTEYFYLIASGDFATEEGFNRKLDGMFTEKFKEQYKGSSSWRDFRFKDGQVYVNGFNHYIENESPKTLFLNLESVDEQTVVLNVMDFDEDNAREYTATLVRTENGGFKIDEVGDGSFFEIPSLFHYKSIQTVVNWQGSTLYVIDDNSSVPSGEPTFLVGPDGNAILTSEITRLENTDKTAETLTEDDQAAEVYCDGFAYYKEPCGIGYNNYKNPEMFGKGQFATRYIGEVPENTNEWKRVYVGDEIFGLKVKSATAHFYVYDWDDLTFPSRYYYDNDMGIELEGTIEAEGFLQIYKRTVRYPETSEMIWFYPSTIDLPLNPLSIGFADNEKGFVTEFRDRCVYDHTQEFLYAGEFEDVHLGYLANVNCDLDGLGVGDIAYARVTLSNITCFRDSATATLEKVELLSDILAHDDDDPGAKPYVPNQ